MQRRQGWASTFFWDICPFMKVTPLACQVRSDSFCFIGIILFQRQLHVSVQLQCCAASQVPYCTTVAGLVKTALKNVTFQAHWHNFDTSHREGLQALLMTAREIQARAYACCRVWPHEVLK